MSRVFVADESRFGRKVVIKVLAPELAAGISAERFEREIKVAASLQQANIVPVLVAGDTNGLPYYTMPFVDGESLRARLVKGGALAISDIVRILGDIARALGYAPYAVAGQPDRARAALSKYAVDVRDTALLRYNQPYLHGVLAEIALAEHRLREAIGEFRRADTRRTGLWMRIRLQYSRTLAGRFTKAGQPDSAIMMYEKYLNNTLL